MVIIRGADKTVVGNVHKLPKILNSGNNFINKLLRSYALCLSLLLNFLSVLVNTGKEHHVISLKALVARHNIGCNSTICVTDMKFV